jgi:hypothetical protein
VFGYAEWRCELLTALAAHDATAATGALEAARAIDDPDRRAKAVIALAPALDGDARAEALGHAIAAVAAIEEGSDRDETLAELEPLLPDALLPDAVRAAIAPVDQREREKLLAMIEEPDGAEDEESEREPEPVLPAGERAAALAAAMAHEDADDRAFALAEVCERIPPAERTQDLSDALASTLDYAAATLRSRGLARSIGWLAPVLPDSLLPRAFAIASRISRLRMRRRALDHLAGLAPTATPTVLHECFDVALRASVEQLDVPRFVRSLLPIVYRLGQLDGGGGPWRPS